MLFDGKPEAAEQVKVGAGAAQGQSRQMALAPPGDPARRGRRREPNRRVLATLGRFGVRTDGAVVFDFGPWHSAVASRRNDDGTTSFISIDPTVDGFDFVVGARNGKRTR